MKIVDIYVDGVITPDDSWFGDSTCSLAKVRDQINAATDADEFRVNINSGGGSCDEGFAISNFLKTCGKPVNTRAIGTCASIATIIFLAGKKREIFNSTQLMVHNPLGYTEGYQQADDLEKKASQLRAEEDRIINEYIAVTGTTREQLAPLMNDETYMTADQALELKFATEIIQPVMALTKKQMVNKSKTAIALQALKAILGMEDATNMEVKTKDGATLVVVPDVSIDATVQIDGADATDGDYTLEDGRMITVVAGKIASVTEAATATDTVDALQAKVATLEAEITKLTTENVDLQLKVTNMTNEADVVAQKFDAITNHLKTLKIDFKVAASKNPLATDKVPTEMLERTPEVIKAEREAIIAKAKKK